MILLLSQDRRTLIEARVVFIEPLDSQAVSSQWVIRAVVNEITSSPASAITMGSYKDENEAKEVLDTILRYLDNNHKGYCLPESGAVPKNKQYIL